jgi:regulator of PEP synthase PpsR (kinase-PPPase family)
MRRPRLRRRERLSTGEARAVDKGDPMPETLLHLVSDSTGETVTAAVAAALSQFGDRAVRRRTHVFVTSEAALDAVLEAVAERPGPVIFTLVDVAMRDRLRARCAALGVETVDVLDPLLTVLAQRLGPPDSLKPGRQHGVEVGYFERVKAIDFAIGYDDGARARTYAAADVILAGVSRTSKTPTCIYLACRGIKAANAPIVPHRPLPDGLAEAAAAGVPVIGLTISPSRLAQIRAHRLETLGQPTHADYADLGAIRREVAEARLVLEGLGAPIIDVTRRSIEETAASVMAMLRERGRA